MTAATEEAGEEGEIEEIETMGGSGTTSQEEVGGEEEEEITKEMEVRSLTGMEIAEEDADTIETAKIEDSFKERGTIEDQERSTMPNRKQFPKFKMKVWFLRVAKHGPSARSSC